MKTDFCKCERSFRFAGNWAFTRPVYQVTWAGTGTSNAKLDPQYTLARNEVHDYEIDAAFCMFCGDALSEVLT